MIKLESAEIICEELGVTLLGIVPLDRVEPNRWNFFKTWLNKKNHGVLKYLEKYEAIRKDPRLILPGATSAWVLALRYKKNSGLSSDSISKVASYACYKDYHKYFWDLEKKLIEKLNQFGLKNFNLRVVSDSAPVLERALAEKLGGGFIGKNTCYIDSKIGSFFTLGFVLTNLESEITNDQESTENEKKSCGTCKRCVVHCPTGALRGDHTIDARKCLSTYSIEYRGLVPFKYWKHFKKYWFGCDICQNVCPFNRKNTLSLRESISFENLDLYDVALMNSSFYEKTFGGTPLTRAKKEGLIRNALIAMTVTHDKRLEEVQKILSEYPHSMVRLTVQQSFIYKKIS